MRACVGAAMRTGGGLGDLTLRTLPELAEILEVVSEFVEAEAEALEGRRDNRG